MGRYPEQPGGCVRGSAAGGSGENLERAIACYQNALRVRTPDHLPSDCQQTLNNLGDLFYGEQRWDRALDAYAQAVAVTERIRSAALDEAGRRMVLHQSWRIFERGTLASLKSAKYTLALTLAERGKTRNLADHLWRREAKPKGVPEEDWRRYQGWLAAQRQAESGGSERERGAVVRPQQRLEELGALGRKIAGMEARFAQADPDYAPLARPLEMEQIGALARRTGAVLVDFRITSEGGYVFLVGPEETAVTADQVVRLPELTSEDLVRRADGWLRAQLAGEVDAVGAEIYQAVIGPMHARLRERYPSIPRLILIPNQALALLPLHAAWWETKDGERRYLLDEYEIAYTPSCQVLERCVKREEGNGHVARSLFAVQNPDGSLPFADWEVEEVARLFGEKRVCTGRAATKSAVLENIGFGEEKLFSTHGWFDIANTDQSHLVLSDGKLFLPEIVPLDLRDAWLVVMSACLTGLTDFENLAIDEYHGLPAAFLVAGAQTVVASLWAVNDVSTALLMQRFHANLYKDKMAKAAALREAQTWLRDLSKQEVEELLAAKQEELTARPRMAAVHAAAALFRLREMPEKPFANPNYWAAFQCIGAGWTSGA